MKDSNTKQTDSYSKITKVVIVVLILLISMWIAASMIMAKYGENGEVIDAEASEFMGSDDSTTSLESDEAISEQMTESIEESATGDSSVSTEQEAEESTGE